MMPGDEAARIDADPTCDARIPQEIEIEYKSGEMREVDTGRQDSLQASRSEGVLQTALPPMRLN